MTDGDAEFDGLSDFDPDEDYEHLENDIPPKKKSKKVSREYELIRSALESHLVEYNKRKHAKKRNVDQITGIVEEYLGSFVLLGYNYEGEPVTIVSATTQQHSDSLSTLLQKFMVDASGNTPGGMM